MDLLDMIIGSKLIGGGGSAPVVEPLSVTENGVYTAPSGVDGYSPVTVDVQSGGGGSSNIVTGTFTLTESGAQNISIPYDGNGYIIGLLVKVKDGRNNSEWADLVANHAMELWGCSKTHPLSNPHAAGGNLNASRWAVCKNSASSATVYTGNISQSYSVYNPDASASAYENTVVVIHSPTELNVYGRSSSYGFALGIEYEYMAMYSDGQ